jgi:hypothetical protein
MSWTNRPLVSVKCGGCCRAFFLQKVRGPWRGWVKVVSGQFWPQPTVRLPERDGRYPADGFRCPDCGGETAAH